MADSRMRKLPKALYLDDAQQYPPFGGFGYSSDHVQYRPMERKETPAAYTPVRLSDLEPHKIITLYKNPIVKEEIMYVKRQYRKIPVEIKKITIQPPRQSIVEPPQPSENEILFNHQKILKERRERKENFLNSIQQKLQQMEQDANVLSQKFKKDEQQLNEINLISLKLERELQDKKMDRKIGQLEQEIQQVMEKEDRISIQPTMDAQRINQELEGLYEGNQRLFDEIDRKLSQEKGFGKGTGFSDDKFKDTVPNGMRSQKSSKKTHAVMGSTRSQEKKKLLQTLTKTMRAN